MMKEVDILTICFASIVYFVIYLFWYSKYLFANIYKKILRRKLNKSFYAYLINFIGIFIISYILNILEILIGVYSFWDGVFLGFLVWIGFAVTHALFLSMTFKRSLKAFFLDAVLYGIGIMIIAGILAG